MNASSTIRHGINWDRAQQLFQAERAAFAAARPKSHALAQRAAQHLMFGVPLHWMNDWSTPFSLYVDEAKGARFSDVDGHQYIDFCLGDTGTMFGHSPEPVAKAIAAQAQKGLPPCCPRKMLCGWPKNLRGVSACPTGSSR